MRRLGTFVLVLALVLALEMWAFRVPPVGARIRTTYVTCQINDRFSGTTEPGTTTGFLDFSINEKCSHYTSLMTVHSVMYLDDTPAGTISRTCLGKTSCGGNDYLTSETPVTVETKSNWAITLPKRFAFKKGSLPDYCVGSGRAIACHHVSVPQTLG